MDSLSQLRAALKTAEADYDEVRRQVEGLRIAIAVMQGDPVPQVTSTKSTEYQDLGVTAAARKLLRERAPEPQDTRSIADELIARGLQTTSKNWIATVYATLRNGKKFNRTEDQRWVLVEESTK